MPTFTAALKSWVSSTFLPTADAPELIRDTMATDLVAGANVTITPDDGANTITIASSGGGTTDVEVVRDTIATALVAGTNVTITPNDGADTITIAATGGGSAAYPPRPTNSGTFIAPGWFGNSTVAAALSTLYPRFGIILIPQAVTIDQVSLEVLDTGTSRTARIGLWTPNATNGLPETLALDSGTFSTDAIGTAVGTVSATIPAGYYWFGVHVSAATSVRTMTSGAFPVDAAADGQKYTHIERSNSALTVPFVNNPLSGATMQTMGQNPPYIRLRVA